MNVRGHFHPLAVSSPRQSPPVPYTGRLALTASPVFPVLPSTDDQRGFIIIIIITVIVFIVIIIIITTQCQNLVFYFNTGHVSVTW
jgi:hypothetical protein